MTTEDHEAMRDVMCNTGSYDMEQKVDELADRWASQISSVYGAMLGQSDRLVERASSDKLKKYKGARDVLDGIRANRATLDKIKNSDLQGANNPKIKAKLVYGIQQHTDWQASNCSGSTGYAEFEIAGSDCSNSIRPGSGCRADCVLLASTCMVVEYKPDSAQAMADGDIQGKAYATGLLAWYARDKKSLFDKYPGVSVCERDSKLYVDSVVKTYSFCPSAAAAAAVGEDLSGISSDVSESE